MFSSALMLFFQLPVHASQSATLSWDATGDSNVAGYNIYYGVASHAYANSVNVGNVTTATVSMLAPDTTYYFAATTYDILGNESDYSNETSYHTPPASGDTTEAGLISVVLAGGQLGFRLSGQAGHSYIIEASTDLIHWVSVETNTAPFVFVDSAPVLPQRYYRAIEQASLTPAAAALTVSASPVAGQFNLAVAGTTGALYVVQASTDLVNWIPVQTNAAPFTFVDTNAASFSRRFFRTFALPP